MSMSEEFNRSHDNDNTEVSSAKQNNGTTSGIDSQTSASGNSDASAQNQGSGGTTYSWVNPKLHQGTGAQGSANPWRTNASGSWNSTGSGFLNRQPSAAVLLFFRFG